MSVTILSITSKGDFEKEYVLMKADANTDIGQYAMFKTGFDGKNVTTRVTDVFWFPDKPVKAGDLILLYTKKGVATQTATTDGGTAHFFYWDKPAALWDAAKCSAVLLHSDKWKHKEPE